MNGLNKFPSRLTKPLETTPSTELCNKQTTIYTTHVEYICISMQQIMASIIKHRVYQEERLTYNNKIKLKKRNALVTQWIVARLLA